MNDIEIKQLPQKTLAEGKAHLDWEQIAQKTLEERAKYDVIVKRMVDEGKQNVTWEEMINAAVNDPNSLVGQFANSFNRLRKLLHDLDVADARAEAEEAQKDVEGVNEG